MVERWVRLFNEGCENVHDELWSGRPSVANEDLVRAFEEIRENRRFTITSLSLNFSQISVTCSRKCLINLKFRKICAHWVPKMLTEEHKFKRQARALDFDTIQ